MSTYCSDMKLDLFDTPFRIDVAYDCFGRDVRVLVDGRSAYVASETAREIAAALIRCADQCDWAADDVREVQP